MMTVDEVKATLPSTLKVAVTQDLVDQLNNMTADPMIAENIKENFISYVSVLREGKYRADEYVNAVAYVSYKMMGYTNQDAYIYTFPQRHAALLARGATKKEISAYVAAYSKGKLVMAILEQAMVPMWLLNQDVYQKAINVQAKLMITAQSELVRTQAANSLLQHLAKPKDAVPLINIDLRPTSGMQELQGLLMDLAEKQVELINKGVTAKEIAAQRIIPGEVDHDAD